MFRDYFLIKMTEKSLNFYDSDSHHPLNNFFLISASTCLLLLKEKLFWWRWLMLTKDMLFKQFNGVVFW